MAIHLLASARAALETTRGTPVTPTRIIYFKEASHSQEVGTITPRESWASFTPFRRTYAGLERNGMTFSGDLTSTQAWFWLNLAVDAEAAPVTSDTTAQTWTWLPVHTSDALKSATFEFAYADLLATVGWRLPGCIVNRFAITWTKAVGGEETGCTYEADIMSAYTATQITAFTGSLSDIAQVSMLGNQTSTYINGTGSAFGTTADTKINQVTWEVNNGYVYRDGFDATSNAIEIVRTAPRMTRTTAQRYFSDKTELDAYIAKTARRLRVKSEGALAGAASAKHTVQLDQSGVWDVHNTTDVDGLVYANLEMVPLNDSSISSDFKLTTIDTTAAAT